jgi:hypothetical protein
MRSHTKDIPLAFKEKRALKELASRAKRAKTRERIGKLARKFLHWASLTSWY